VKNREVDMQAYVLINLSTTNVADALKKIRGADGVKYAHLVTGLHDIVAFIEADSLKGLRDVIVNGLLSIPDVSKTITMIVVDGE